MSKELSPDQAQNRKRILDISYENKLSHIGSCLTAVDIIDAIYQIKEGNERFVLSSGHAALALYVILEKKGILPEINMHKLHIHPDQNSEIGIDVSTGSLGQGLPIAVGIALADQAPNKNVYCVISDGECAEGSVWEALRIGSENNLSNLKIVVNANGFGAYKETNPKLLKRRFQAFGWRVLDVNGHNIPEIINALLDNEEPVYLKDITPPTIIMAHTQVQQFDFLEGIDAHYHVLSTEDHTLATNKITKQLPDQKTGKPKKSYFQKQKNTYPPSLLERGSFEQPKRHESMRGWLAYELYKQMQIDPRIWLLTGDLGYGMLDNIKDNFPNRFLNVGAAEQAMVGIGAGLAIEGKIPFLYSISPFLLRRAYESIYLYMHHDNIPVKLICSGRNKDYEHDGITHWPLEDKSLMDILENIESFWPETKEEIPELLKHIISSNKPAYLNLKR